MEPDIHLNLKDHSKVLGPCWFWVSPIDDADYEYDFDYVYDAVETEVNNFTPNGNLQLGDPIDEEPAVMFYAPDGDSLVVFLREVITTTELINGFNPDSVVSDVKSIIVGFRDFIDAQCSKVLTEATKRYLNQ